MPSHNALIVTIVCCCTCIPQLVCLAIAQLPQLSGMPSVERKSAAQSSSALCIGSQPCSQPTSFLVGCGKMMEDGFCMLPITLQIPTVQHGDVCHVWIVNALSMFLLVTLESGTKFNMCLCGCSRGHAAEAITNSDAVK